MKPKTKWGLIPIFALLLLSALACNLSSRLQQVNQTIDTAGTAQAAAQQAGGIVETVAAEVPEQSSAAIATIQAADSPDVKALQDRLANVQPDESGNYTVMITEDELNSVLQLRQTLTDPGSQVQLQNAVVTFSGGNITLDAKLIHPLPADIGITLLPMVVSGRVRLEVRNANLGPVKAPQLVLSGVEAAVNTALDQALNNVPSGVHVESITVGDNALTIVGRPS